MMNSNTVKKLYKACRLLVFIMVLFGVHACREASLSQIRLEYVRDIVVDTMGILMAGVLLIGLTAEEDIDEQNKTMFRMILALINLMFFDILSSIMEGNPNYVLGIKLVNTASFINEELLGFFFWLYIRDELKLKGKFLRITDSICIFFIGITMIFDLLNWKLGCYFTISNAGEYIYGPYESVSNLSILIVFIVATIAILSRTEKTINEKTVLMSFIIFPCAAYAIGTISQDYLWVNPASLLSVFLIYIRIFSERGRKLALQQVELGKQKTALMISQIQPHFIYNVLTTISNLCVTDPEEAEETTVLFAQYLRINLDSLRNEELVPFSTELGHIKTYAQLEKKRFGEKLNVEYDIKEQNFMVPSLGFQPIVENSIKHGIRGKSSPGCVKISSYKADGGYMVVIEDDGVGFDMSMPPKEDGRSHVGMINVKERLKQMCNATVKVESSPGNGCRTEIFIPE